jgi:hypothetical protein
VSFMPPKKQKTGKVRTVKTRSKSSKPYGTSPRRQSVAKPAASRGGGAPKSGGPRGPRRQSDMFAPAAVSMSSHRKAVGYASTTVDGIDGMHVSSRVPIAQIGNDAFNNGFIIQGSGTNAAFTASVCDVAPYEIAQSVSATSSTPVSGPGSWISPHVPLLALAFDRYRVTALEFSYEPQATSTLEDRMIFAWTDDPNHPFLSAAQNLYNSATPSQLSLLVTKDSVAFMPWKPWTLRVPVAKDIRFMYSDSDLEEAATQGSLARFSQFGSMSCVGGVAKTVSAETYGILYVSLVIDLLDPVPIVTGTPLAALIASLHHSKRIARQAHFERLRKPRSTPRLRTESKEEVKQPPHVLTTESDWDPADPSPPSTRATAPSSYPGAPAYVPSVGSLVPPPIRIPSRK